MDMPFGQRLARVFTRYRFPCAIVPQHDGAAAIFASGDQTFESGINKRVILGPHRQGLVVGIGARPASDGPADPHAVQLQPEIIMQPRRGMLLDDKAIAGRRKLRTGRLGRVRKIVLRPIERQAILRRFVLRLGHAGSIRPFPPQSANAPTRSGGIANGSRLCIDGPGEAVAGLLEPRSGRDTFAAMAFIHY